MLQTMKISEVLRNGEFPVKCRKTLLKIKRQGVYKRKNCKKEYSQEKGAWICNKHHLALNQDRGGNWRCKVGHERHIIAIFAPRHDSNTFA